MAKSTAGSASARVVVAVALIGLSGAWNAGNVGPVASEIAREFDVSLAVVGLLAGTLFLGSMAVGLLIAAQVGERTGLVRGLRLSCSSCIDASHHPLKLWKFIDHLGSQVRFTEPCSP